MEFTADNNSDESKLCVEAAEGNMSLNHIAELLGVSMNNLDSRVKCNGEGITKFVADLTKPTAESAMLLTERNIELSVNRSNKDALLCAVAATGDINKVKSVARVQGVTMKRFVKSHRCNDLSLMEFVNQYGGESAVDNFKKYHL
jgi:hypothetical protein